VEGQTPLITPPPTMDLHLEERGLDEGRERLRVFREKAEDVHFFLLAFSLRSFLVGSFKIYYESPILKFQ
jgi:hypothetical protein